MLLSANFHAISRSAGDGRQGINIMMVARDGGAGEPAAPRKTETSINVIYCATRLRIGRRRDMWNGGELMRKRAVGRPEAGSRRKRLGCPAGPDRSQKSSLATWKKRRRASGLVERTRFSELFTLPARRLCAGF